MIWMLAGLLVILGLAGGLMLERRARERRLAVLIKRLEALETKVDEEAARRSLQHYARRWRWARTLLVQADLEAERRRISIAVAVAAALAVLAGFIKGPIGFMVIAAIAVAAAFVTTLVVAARRRHAFVAGLPHLLDAIRQSLSSGSSLHQAILRSVGAAPAPVRRYLESAARRIDHGDAVHDAVGWAADQVDIEELHMLAVALEINARHGGAVTPILMGLSRLLRNRARTERELSAATSQTRMSANVLTLTPIVAGALGASMNPKYVSFLLATEQGNMLLATAVTLMLIGVVLIRRLLRLDY
ncbi:type II secretion system F family protein [Caulobacter segnis]|uniref:type II secretion system F family protein n=1 Tax=Caulobacter segnis TaxID=88688 RepID=UPI002410366B|nr:type II secretion system F family protein [Caulobacter segnis]MDG2520729.1 type II secretion system F family protein [Caulobacter segnis]